MKRLLVIAATTALASGSGLAATALAAPSQSGLTHRNVHVCATPTTVGIASCHAIRHDTLRNGKPVAPSASVPSGFGPAALHAAYHLPDAPANGTPTIAIVDAYDLPTAEADLNVYRSYYYATSADPHAADVNTAGNPTFRKVGQDGGAPPAVNASWGQEIALDIEMATAICRDCNILLVEAKSASLADLATAVKFAATQGVVTISNSYGGSETSPNTAYNQPGIAVTVSTGDSGYGVQSPASYPWATAVGGTSLKVSGSTYSETAWSGAGSGCSRYSTQPSWQTSVAIIKSVCSKRALADVSAVADPNTGVAVYDSTAYQGAVGWLKFGGTSVAAPVIAGVYALANNGGDNATPYAHTGSLNDVQSGRNGRCNRTAALCTAGSGWDGPTGLGTPNGLGAF